ncbi:unnamed protein product [Linum trigynum]|uniref:Transmembrane protein 53 n=1 Tax=Linum trigynum TaxID=586398 RepID=A0AAV2CWE3_9ROSI
MEAAAGTARVFNRRLYTNFIKPSHLNPRIYRLNPIVRAAPVSFLQFNPPNSRPINVFLSLSSSHLSNSSNPFENFTHTNFGSQSTAKEGLFKWHLAPDAGINGSRSLLVGPKDPVATVVLLGWLGAKQKHLRKYVECYNSLGIHAVTFVVDAGELLGFDLGERVERRIAALADELISWVTQRGEEDGRERCLLFHTFSNTGFLTYGYVIDIMQSREGVTNKIKGCVVDSGGAGLLDHKVWAAGFAAALLKKRSSAVPNSEEETNSQKTRIADSQSPDLIETLVLGALEIFFSVVLKFPEVDRKLRKTVAAVSNNQLLNYPRLYLYSTGDIVVPHELIEAAIEEERRKGRRVVSHNFQSSPHVDHFRAFPETYLSVVHGFLKVCFSNVAAATAADVKPHQ